MNSAKTRALRNLRYLMKKKGYTFLKAENICIMPESSVSRSVIQERHLQSLGVSVQYNMFQE